MKHFLLIPLLALVSADALARACVITSNDQELPIRMCQQNISILPAADS